MRMDNKHHRNLVGFNDLLFNMLIGVTFLFLLSFILINPADDRSKIDPKAEYLFILDWPDHHNSDIDLWARDPAGEVIGFKTQEQNIAALERDDLGSQTDTHEDINGNVVYNPTNREVITVRGVLPGEWIVNVHYYRSSPIPKDHVSRKQTPPYSDPKRIPVPIHVQIVKLNPTYHIIVEKKIILTFEGEERTMARFVLNDKGEVINILQAPYKFIVGYE